MAYEKQKTDKHEYWQKHIRACAQSGMSQGLGKIKTKIAPFPTSYPHIFQNENPV
jgi:hypothetical protein